MVGAEWGEDSGAAGIGFAASIDSGRAMAAKEGKETEDCGGGASAQGSSGSESSVWSAQGLGLSTGMAVSTGVSVLGSCSARDRSLKHMSFFFFSFFLLCC